jgi:hypothetical protein
MHFEKKIVFFNKKREKKMIRVELEICFRHISISFLSSPCFCHLHRVDFTKLFSASETLPAYENFTDQFHQQIKLQYQAEIGALFCQIGSPFDKRHLTRIMYRHAWLRGPQSLAHCGLKLKFIRGPHFDKNRSLQA